MSELIFCKICLTTGVKVYRQDEFNLESYYMDLMGSTVTHPNLSAYFCFECAMILYKTNKFKEKCQNGNNVLKSILLDGPVTQRAIDKVNRKHHKLNSTIARIIISNRIGTFSYGEDFTVIYDSPTANVTYELTVKEEPPIEVFSSSLDQLFENENDFDVKPSPFSSDDEISLKESLQLNDDTSDESSQEPVRKVIKRKSLKKSSIGRKKKIKVKKKEDFAIKIKDKVKFAKQREAARKFDPDKWRIVELTEEEMHKEFHQKGDSENYQNSLHYCEHCLKVFISEDTLQRHMKVHSLDKGNHECYLCKRRFHWEARLRTHMKTHQIRYHCLKCNEICKSSNTAFAHEKIHEGVIYQCKYCDAKFIKRSSYYTHVRESHRSEHICRICGASFFSKYGVNQHQKNKHPELSLKISDDIIKDTEEVYCNICDMTFKTLLAFEEHKKNSAKHENDPNSKPVKSINRDKLFKEGMCPDGDIRCDQCNEVFSTKAAMERHRGKVHRKLGVKKRYICEICGASLAVSSIQSHKNRHTKMQIFPCNTCGKTFKTTSERRRHIRTHTGERPYSCSYCDKRFATRQSARMHHEKYHSKTNKDVVDHCN